MKRVNCPARLRFAIVTLVIGFGCICISPADAQLFGGKGVFGNKKQKAPIPKDPGVPIPIAGKVATLKGQEIEFEIRAQSKTPAASVEFLIRDFPIAGKITKMVSKEGERNKAIVTYWADPNSAATNDAFSFAVRYRGGRYSSAMRYDIDLGGGGASAGTIEVVSSVDFGKIPIGGEVIKDIFVKNKGSSPFSRQVILYSPWHVIEPSRGKITLSAGSTQKLTVAFRPALIGKASYSMGLSRSKTGMCLLKGESLDPFSFSVEEAELLVDEKSRRRMAEVGIVNHGKESILLKVLASTRLKNSLGNTISLKPGDKNKLQVYLSKNDVIPFEGAVELSLENGFGKTVNFFAEAVPGKITVEIPDSVTSEVMNFGQVPAGQGIERRLILRNIGGEAVPMDFELLSPFRLMAKPPERLASQAEVSVSVGLFPANDTKGAVDSSLKIFFNDKVASVRLLGNIVKPKKGVVFNKGISAPAKPLAPSSSVNRLSVPTPMTSTPAVQPTTSPGIAAATVPPKPRKGSLLLDDSKPGSVMSLGNNSGADGEYIPIAQRNLTDEEKETLKSPLGFVTGTYVLRDFSDTVRSAEDLKFDKGGKNRITLSWTAPKNSERYSYDVEVRRMIPLLNSPKPESVWISQPGVKYERTDRLMQADIGLLEAGREYEFRVITLNEDAKAAYPTRGILAETAPPTDWKWIILGSFALVLGGIAFATRKIIRDHKKTLIQATQSSTPPSFPSGE